MNDLKAKLARAAELKAQIDRLAPLKLELEELKFDIMAEMQKVGSKRTDAYSGFYAVRAARTNVAVADRATVEKWLIDNDFALDEYQKLDEARVKALADSRLHETGEILPGLEVTETEYITLKKEITNGKI